MSNTKRCKCRPLGRTVVRNRLLNRLGYVVVAIPYGEWETWQSQSVLSTYLLAKVDAAVAEQRCNLPKDTSALNALAPKVTMLLCMMQRAYLQP